MGSALVNVFMDENAVSPTLLESCKNTWSGEAAGLLAASLLHHSPKTGIEVIEELPAAPATLPSKEAEELEPGGIILYESCEGSPNSSCINEIVKSRARHSVIQQRDHIVNAVQSVRKDGSIQSKASELAAERLRALASQIS